MEFTPTDLTNSTSILVKRVEVLEEKVAALTTEETDQEDAKDPFADDVIFSGTALFKKAVELMGNASIAGTVTIHGNAIFFGEIMVNNRQAGFAKIVENGTSVAVQFTAPLSSTPIINITAQGNAGAYWVDDVSSTGFTIKVSKVLSKDITFGWTATVARDPQTTTGSPIEILEDVAPSPTFTPSVVEGPTATPEITPTPEPPSNTSGQASISPSPEVTPGI